MRQKSTVHFRGVLRFEALMLAQFDDLGRLACANSRELDDAGKEGRQEEGNCAM